MIEGRYQFCVCVFTGLRGPGHVGLVQGLEVLGGGYALQEESYYYTKYFPVTQKLASGKPTCHS